MMQASSDAYGGGCRNVFNRSIALIRGESGCSGREFLLHDEGAGTLIVMVVVMVVVGGGRWGGGRGG